MGFIKNLKEAVKLDIYDLNYSISSPEYKDFVNSADDIVLRKTIPERIAIYYFYYLKFLFKFELKYPYKKNSKVLLFSSSKNQSDSLNPVVQKLKDFLFVGYSNFAYEKFPMTAAYLWSYFFFPVLLKRYFSSKDYQRESYKIATDSFWLTYGYYLCSRKLLNKNSPSLLVVSNDHIMLTRTLVKSANDENIKTAYLQHASVSEKSPALNFDYAFLDGIDALNKYSVKGSEKTKVFLTGIAKFDKYYDKINKNLRMKKLGICVNNIDPDDRIIELCGMIRKKFEGLEISLRPHPDDFVRRKKLWNEIIMKSNFSLSDSRTQNSFDYLCDVDAVIAGVSNLLLEAVIMNVYPIQYNFSGRNIDMYGFLKNRLIEKEYGNTSEIISILEGLKEKKDNIRFKAKYYCSTIDTKYDGKSSDLVVKLINEIVKDKIDYSIWESIKESNSIEAYRLIN